MSANLLETIVSRWTLEVARGIGVHVGEAPERTKRALHDASALFLGGLVRLALQDPKGQRLARVLTEGKPDIPALDDLPAIAANSASVDALAHRGRGLLRAILGDRASAAAERVTRASGVTERSAGTLLALAGAMTVAAVRRESCPRTLGPDRAASAIANQKGPVGAAVDRAELARVFGTADDWTKAGEPPRVSEVTRIGERTGAARAAKKRGAPSLPAHHRASAAIVVASGVIVLGVLFLLGVRKPVIDADNARPPVGPSSIAVREARSASAATQAVGGGPLDSAAELQHFFDDPRDSLSQRVVVREARFAPGSAELDAAALAALGALAAILREHPWAKIRVEGYAANAGDSDARLSVERAEVARRALVQEGVDGARIRAAGYGSDRPLAEHRMADGRAEDRGIELVVER